MKYTVYFYLIVLFLFPVNTFAQRSIDQLHGDQEYHRRGIHDGNRIRISFGNDGNFGRRSTGEVAGGTEYGCEWPKGEAEIYTSKIILMPMAEVRDINNQIQHIVSECHGTGTTEEYKTQTKSGASVGDLDGQRWRTMCPLDGFIRAELMYPDVPADSVHPALSDDPEGWPEYWPDKMKEADPGWRGEWNGYFGKGQIRADQESYWVADDYQNDEFDFYPDEFDPLRRGIGLRMYYRGLQWNNPLVEDVMYVVYDVENIGTGSLDKVNFAMHPDFDNGDTVTDYDPTPDSLCFNRKENWYYSFDKDNFGANNFTPVGYIAYAMFETPGNEFDGIDNDDDGHFLGGKTITEDDFSQGILEYNTPIIIVDYETYERETTTLSDLQQTRPELFSGDTLIISFIGRPQKFWPGKELVEIWFDNFDNNLNGLIDENNGAIVGEDSLTQETRFLYVGYMGIDYFTGEGKNNPMLDESRKDGIDNDGDWDPLIDDVGVDGKPFTGDDGEGDGVPTSKYQGGFVYDAPGEPHIDATDISESDLLGMTAFGQNLTDWVNYPLDNDEKLWNTVIPGNMVEGAEKIENAFMGSGYFPMPAKHIERFSGAFMLSYSLDGLTRTKRSAELAFEKNYQFYMAPYRPKLTALPGDGRVTLFWDDNAEASVDPILGKDFEGYRIYRSTDNLFPRQITNPYGDPKLMIPIAQFDLDNDIKGLSAGVINGVQFYLGDDTGLKHKWVDTTVVNGQRYYYVITSYDHGDETVSPAVQPTECNYDLTPDPVSGEVSRKSSNAVVVTPNAPSPGYLAATSDVAMEHIEGYSSSNLAIEVLDSPDIKDNNTYRVTFKDTVLGYGQGSALVTKSFTLANKTTGETLILNSAKVHTGRVIPVTEGFRLVLMNYDELKVDTLKTKFNREGIYEPIFKPFFNGNVGNIRPADYRIVFGEIGIDTSTVFKPEGIELSAKPVNFAITNLTENTKIDFAISDSASAPDSTKGILNGGKWKDGVYFLEKDENGDLVTTWYLTLATGTEDDLNPAVGDTLYMYTIKPFLSNDIYEFTTIGEKFDIATAKADMDRIRVVPNPYVVTNTWERANPYSTGRGP
ncbi:hypothetical protein JXQ31_00990, partial [candidate division KSB1 bacterium]|nr:hypothetical protein [candidate division KSB1 bacterium]